jgi:hypothetical protein
MPETLLSEATIHLFGRVMSDLSLTEHSDAGAARSGEAAGDAQAKDQEPASSGDAGAGGDTARTGPADVGPIQRALGRRGRTIARIYAFAFQNEYVELASPALFVLKDDGEPLEEDLDRTGLSRIPEELNEDLTVWKVERDDMTVRLDISAGSFDRVLLEYELADSGLQDFVRGGGTLGTPTAVSSRARRRPRGWRSDDD